MHTHDSVSTWPRNRSAQDRILEIHNAVRSGTYPTKRSFVERFEVSERTIERDFEHMKDFLGAPLEYDNKKRGYTYTEEWDLPVVRLTEGEAIAVYLGEKLLLLSGGAPFVPHIKTALEKLEHMLPQEMNVSPETLDRIISFSQSTLRGDKELLIHNHSVLFDSTVNQQVVRMEYKAPSSGESVREVEPYGIHFINGIFYLVAFCRLRKEFRVFSLDRIKSLTVSDKSFVKDETFSLERFFADSWSIEKGQPYEIRLRFSPRQAPWIRERVWHESQKITELNDGGLDLQLQVQGLGEVKRWVMGYGADVEVIEPQELREQIADEILALKELYGLR